MRAQVTLAVDAEEEAERRVALLREAEEAYEAANNGQSQADAGAGTSPKGTGGTHFSGYQPASQPVKSTWLGWMLGDDFDPPQAQSEDRAGMLAKAEQALLYANWAAMQAIQEREERVSQRVAALEKLLAAEGAHQAAVHALARCPPLSPPQTPAPQHDESEASRLANASLSPTQTPSCLDNASMGEPTRTPVQEDEVVIEDIAWDDDSTSSSCSRQNGSCCGDGTGSEDDHDGASSRSSETVEERGAEQEHRASSRSPETVQELVTSKIALADVSEEKKHLTKAPGEEGSVDEVSEEAFAPEGNSPGLFLPQRSEGCLFFSTAAPYQCASSQDAV